MRDLLKDKPYVALAYMTGVLPIKKYSTGSALNMFREYTMLNDHCFEEYFGFTQAEVEMLCGKQSKLTLSEISEWYNGYMGKNGERLYNPRSVVCALEDGVCQSYWTRTGNLGSREEIYAAMIIYGLLSYHDGELDIPNKELMLEFQKAIRDDDFGYVAELVKNSNEILDATLEGREDGVVSYCHFADKRQRIH